VRTLSSAELAALLRRGNELVSLGDLVGARLVFERAAQAGDSRAALALASTYDPLVLQQLGERGLAPDIAMARFWYEKAKELGSKEAPERLEVLVSRSN
jgi:TPR repeat protein